jgi:hypothetical protein
MTTPYSDPWEGKTPTLPPPVKDPLDQELAAMRIVDGILSRLDDGARARVLSWIHSRVLAVWQVPASATVTDGDTPWPTHTVDDIRPKVVDPGDAVADYEWPNVVVYLDSDEPIVTEGGVYTAADARKIAAELLSAAHRVDTHTETSPGDDQ